MSDKALLQSIGEWVAARGDCFERAQELARVSSLLASGGGVSPERRTLKRMAWTTAKLAVERAWVSLVGTCKSAPAESPSMLLKLVRLLVEARQLSEAHDRVVVEEWHALMRQEELATVAVEATWKFVGGST